MAFQINSNVISFLNNRNTDLYVDNVKLVLGDSIEPNTTVVAKARSGYRFTVDGIGRSNVYFSHSDGMGGSSMLRFDLNESKTEGTVVYQQVMFNMDYGSFIAVTETMPMPSGFQIDSDVIDLLEESNVDLYVNDSQLGLGDTITHNEAVVAKARLGYVFTVDSINRANIYFWGSDGSGGRSTLWFELNESRTEGTVVYNSDYPTLFIITEQAPEEVVGANNVYLINSTDLATINTERFVPDGLGEVRDYGSFILSVLALPFDVPEDYILNDESVQLSSLQTSVEAPKLSNDVITVDMGSITVAPAENNLLDYANTVTTLHLPRVDSVILDSNFVIGETISVEYLIDCYTGGATINVHSTKLDDVFLTLEADLGISVPYASESRTPTANNTNVIAGGDNGITVPFIEVARNDAILPYGFFTVPVPDEGLLNNSDGFIKVDEIRLDSLASGSEREDIINLLRSGVIIQN